MMTKEMVLFESSDGVITLPVSIENETVWLSQQQMAKLFGKDRTVIAKHIKNAIEEGEIDPKVVCANFAHTTRHGAMSDKMQQHEIVCYNLDVIISVGYRVHSSRGGCHLRRFLLRWQRSNLWLEDLGISRITRSAGSTGNTGRLRIRSFT